MAPAPPLTTTEVVDLGVSLARTARANMQARLDSLCAELSAGHFEEAKAIVDELKLEAGAIRLSVDAGLYLARLSHAESELAER